MADTVKIDRDALADLVMAVTMLTRIIQRNTKNIIIPDDDLEKLKYVNKLIETAMKSFDNHNKPLTNDTE